MSYIIRKKQAQEHLEYDCNNEYLYLLCNEQYTDKVEVVLANENVLHSYWNICPNENCQNFILLADINNYPTIFRRNLIE